MAGNDWIEWKGGECPVEKGTLVDVRLKSGFQHDGRTADYWGWGIDEAMPIIAYRLHKPEATTAPDLVNNPPHYKQGDIECIDAIKAALTDEEFRGYCKGNVIKYLWRSQHKGAKIQDEKKAQWYLNRMIENARDMEEN